jgi:hypothetical protein
LITGYKLFHILFLKGHGFSRAADSAEYAGFAGRGKTQFGEGYGL